MLEKKEHYSYGIINKTQHAITLVYNCSDYANNLYATSYNTLYNYFNSTQIANSFKEYPIISTLISAEFGAKALSAVIKIPASIASFGYGCAAYASHLWEGISVISSNINLRIIAPLYGSNVPGIDKALIFTGRCARRSHDISLSFGKVAQFLQRSSGILTKTSSLVAAAAPTNIMFTTLNAAQTVAVAHPVAAGVVVLGGTIIGVGGLTYYLYKNHYSEEQVKSKEKHKI